MEFIISLFLNGLLILGLSRILEGIQVEGFTSATIAALLFAIVNTFVKPLLVLITIPVNILTLGLFTFVINALMVILVGKLMNSFSVKDFWWALLFSLGMSVGSTVIGWFGFAV